MRRIGLTMLACACLSAVLSAQENRVVRSLELGTLMRAGGEGESVVFRSPCGGGMLVDPDPDVVPPVPEDLLLRLLQGVAGDSQVHIFGSRAIVAGEAGAVARAVGMAEGLVQSLGKPVVVQAWWIHPGDAPPAAAVVLKPEEAGAILQGFRPGGSMRLLGEARVLIPLGGSGRWEREEVLDRVGRYEVEVASKSTITRPALEPLVSGERLRLMAAPAPGGRVALFFEAWRVSSQRLRRVFVGNPRVPWVEPASADGLLVAGSAVLGRGEAILVQQQDGQGSTWILIQLQEAPAPMEGLVFLGPLFLPWHMNLGQPMPPWQGQESVGWESLEEEEDSAPLSTDLFDRLAGSVGLVPRTLLPAGALLTGGAWRPDLYQRLSAGLALDRERSVQVELLVKGVPQARAEGMDAEAILRQGELLQHLAFPVLAGRQGLFLSGREAQFLGTYEVEIAEKAAQATPFLSSAWSGLTGRIEAGDGGLRLTLQHHWAGEPETVPTEARDLGPVERVLRRRIGLAGEWLVDGRLHLLGEGASRGKGEELWRVAVGVVAR